MMRSAILVGLFAFWGCTSDPPATPSVSLDTSPLCDGNADSCLNAETTTHVVSGVHVIHKRVRGEPVVAVQVLFDGKDASSEQLWAESLALSMFRLGGSRDFDLPAWKTAQSNIGATITSSMGYDYVSVSAIAPVTYFADVWDLMARALRRPANDDYLLGFLRDFIHHGFDTEMDEPMGAAQITAWSSLLEGNLANRLRETQGTIDRVGTSNVDEAWADMLTKERLWVVVVGDVAWSELAPRVSDAFGRLPSSPTAKFAAAPPPPEPPTASRARVLDFPDAPNWQIHGYFFGPSATDPEYRALALAVEILNRRLYTAVREENGLAYSVGARLVFARQSIGGISAATDSPSEALPIMARVIADLVATAPSSDELAAARVSLKSTLLSQSRTPSDLAYTLGNYQLVLGDRLAIDDYLRALSTVTPEDARRALERYVHAVSLAAAGGGEALDRAALLAVLPQATSEGGL